MKRVFTVATTTALLVVALASPALATGVAGQGSQVPASLPSVPMGITIPKDQWGSGAKQPVPNRPKSVHDKQLRAVDTSKQLDLGK